jgi:hypothetical protein
MVSGVNVGWICMGILVESAMENIWDLSRISPSTVSCFPQGNI